MYTSFKSYFSICWFCFLLLNLLNETNAQAQVKDTTILNKKFDLGDKFGDREIYKIDIEAPGQLHITAKWKGTATKLAFILNGPGQKGYYARKDGNSPLEIVFNITEELISKGKTWTISIINFGQVGIARGKLEISYPFKNKLLRYNLRMTNKNPTKMNTTDDLVSSIDQSPTSQRRILEDGTIEIRYSDGTIKYLGQCGYRIVNPDGTQMMVTCIQVPPVLPPSLPGDNKITAFLEWQTLSLLDFIKILLSNNETSINNFLNYESENTNDIYGKMDLRTNYINRLISE